MWDVKEPKHYSKRVGREVPGVVAVLCVVNTGPMLIAVTITEMVILYKYVEIIIIIFKIVTRRSDSSVWCTATQAKEMKRNLNHGVRYFCNAK